MRQKKASKRGRLISLLVATGIGYLVGAWHTAAMFRQVALSPAQEVALRFPENAGSDAARPPRPHDARGAPTEVRRTVGANVLGNTRLALLSPDPLVTPVARPAVFPVPQAATQDRIAEPTAPSPSSVSVPLPPPRTAVTRPGANAESPTGSEAGSAAGPWARPGHRQAKRPGFVLNDAGIARIKRRLHLTPEQERMWPAVAAALRNIAYARAHGLDRDARAGRTDLATLDPDSASVQDLKSAAIPLIMSFSDEQKSEVRNLAHVMGLDNLASEF